ncbi:uncharacterized protein LOC123311467 isoform X5 [Coccinella septempunctata]|nr:uncharacterized protein LOC123311467 isoform X5 [Coccinella septempunctata]
MKTRSLGKTPNHLTLSTTSTLSAGSTGSQAKLIQSSHNPEDFQPVKTDELGKQINKKIIELDMISDVPISSNPSPKKSPIVRSPNRIKKEGPNNFSPKFSRRSKDGGLNHWDIQKKSPRKLKSSLKNSAKILTSESPTCIECYLSGKSENTQHYAPDRRGSIISSSPDLPMETPFEE